MDYKPLQKKLRDWFLENHRILPWREYRTPYSTLVAEIMLQQTQSSVVIPYFKKWMEIFPDWEALASAEEGHVLKTWEGLGYYSRARRLHSIAKVVTKEFDGQLPHEKEKLQELKGLGPYTIGAIQSFAFRKRSAAVDGNVIRVLTRLFAIEEEVTLSKTLNQIWEYAEHLLPEEEPWVVTESLIELGALVCQKTPQCGKCPLEKECKARKMGIEKSLPKKKPREKTIHLTRHVAIVHSNSSLLVFQEKERRVMEGLYQFPYDEDIPTLKNKLQLSLELLDSLPEVTHSFTKYKVTLIPYLFTTSDTLSPEGFEWKSFDTLKKLPFSSGHRKIWRHLQDEHTAIRGL